MDESAEKTGKYRLGDDVFGWSTACAGAGHESCNVVLVADLDPVLSRTEGLGAVQVKTPLQVVLCAFILRQLGSTTASHRLVETIVRGEPGCEMVLYLGGRGDTVTATPTTEHLDEAMELFVRGCNCGGPSERADTGQSRCQSHRQR